MDWQVPLSDIDLGDAEIEAVTRVLRSRWLSMGPVTQQFEAAFAAMCGSKHAFAVSNGTTALHLAYAALGLGPGDEVIVPALTFVATANAIRYTGATPVFADVTSLDDLTISPADIATKIGPRTRAIAVMHYGGYLCDMDAIAALARQHGLAVVEDACHAPGASYKEHGAGTLGDVGCFSFFANKNLATGEGGMVTTNRDDLAERIRLLRSHGMTTLTWDRHRGHAASYDVVATGFNYRLDEIHSALGLAQLGKLSANNRRRADLAGQLRAELSGLTGLTDAVQRPGGRQPACVPHLPRHPGSGARPGWLHGAPAQPGYPKQRPLPAYPPVFCVSRRTGGHIPAGHGGSRTARGYPTAFPHHDRPTSRGGRGGGPLRPRGVPRVRPG